MIQRLLLVALLGLVAGCGGSHPSAGGSGPNAAERAASRHLRRQIDAAPRTLDPALSTEVPAQRILDDLFEGLTRIDGNGAVVPGVASTWERSPDGLTWTFHLRPDARWSNGDPVTAEDFVYGWRRTVDPATASEYAQQYAPLRNGLEVAAGKRPVSALGVRAADARTLIVELNAPTPYFLYLLTNNYFSPTHAATIRAHGASWTRPGVLVSNGPFMLKDLLINGAVTLVRNPQYYAAGEVRLDTVTYYPVADRGAVTARFLAGDIDFSDGFNVEDIDWLRRDLGSQVQLAPYFGIVKLSFYTRRPPFDSKPLRQALAMAIDREVLTGKLLRGLFLPATNLVPPYEGYEAQLPQWAHWSPEKRLARARELYAEAGYSREHPLVVTLSHQTTSPDTVRLLEAIVAMWRMNLGADVRLESEEWRVFLQNRRLGKHALYWDAWIGDYPDPYTFLSLNLKDDGNNHGRYSSPAFESVMQQATTTANDGERLQLFRRAEEILNEDAPSVPVYFYQSRHLVRPYVRGWVGNVMDRNPSRNLYLAADGGS
jgi:oligopeptide transport system substrate-binding protein